MFSDRLKALRTQAGLTQEGLARRADLSTATVAKLERKDQDQDPNWSTVCKLADALGVGVQEFREQPAPDGEAGPTVKGKGKKGHDHVKE